MKTDREKLMENANTFTKWIQLRHPEITSFAGVTKKILEEYLNETQEKKAARFKADRQTLIPLADHARLRTAEYQKLKVSDLDLENGKMHIKEGMGGKTRTIEISAVMIEIIRKHISAQELGGDDSLFTLRQDSIHHLLLQQGLMRHMEVYEKHGKTKGGVK